VAVGFKQPWGSQSTSIEFAQYLNDPSKYHLSLYNYTTIRLFKGLSLTLNLEAARINDQLNLRKGELSEAERLLRLREQATGYQFQAGIGLSYTFGSIYNNIVNPRFGN
jgi:hypothetical protein